MNTQRKADMMLVLVTLCWGVSYFFMNICLRELGPFTINMFRFCGAFVIAAALSFPKLRTVNRTTLKYSMIISIALVFVYTGVTFGVKYTSLSNSGFLSSLTVVFTPVLAFFIKKQKPDKKLAIVVLMCLIGVALMTLNERFQMAPGDIFCLMCAVSYAADLLITESAISKEEVNAFQLGIFQLGFTGVIMLMLALLFEEPHLPASAPVWGAISFLAIFCTGVAFIVQAIAQQHTTASHVGVIFALEPVFAAIVAFVFAGERLLLRAYIGAAMMLIGVFAMELDLKNITAAVKGKLCRNSD